MNPFLRRLGINLPIIQAPMAGVSTPKQRLAGHKLRRLQVQHRINHFLHRAQSHDW